MYIFLFLFLFFISMNVIIGIGDLILLIIIPILLCMWWGLLSERKQWNNGICKISGKSWILFDMDSQGGRGYTDYDGNYCWISYDIDKNYEHNRI